MPAPVMTAETAALSAPETARPRAKPAQSLRLWTRSRGPVVARGSVLERARELNALLLAPIGVLPAAEGEPVRPFRIGIGAEIVARRRPEVEIDTCKRAIRDYSRSFTYRFATAQPDAMRHDLGGHPVEPVSDADRRFAQHSCQVDQERSRRRKAAALAEAAMSGIEPGSAGAHAPAEAVRR
ncbi:ProQ/FinO family protein [Methylobacterium currus]|uniref:ProQ/FINO family protein n=1 Tax=Methylobacterium currus TaxID=2051553 RepID=UPI001E484545|nr:ProQ/FINO family protein [Methylobacterium currus]UHC17887.1 ProQ/FinO family protein [Methylobacterium currus]